LRKARQEKMRNQSIKELKNLINRISCSINQLKNKADKCGETSRAYNRLLIQRACIRKRLKDIESRNVISFFIKKLRLQSKPKQICDYFKTQ